MLGWIMRYFSDKNKIRKLRRLMREQRGTIHDMRVQVLRWERETRVLRKRNGVLRQLALQNTTRSVRKQLRKKNPG